MKEEFEVFVDHWHTIALIWAKISFVMSVVVIATYYMLFMLKKSMNSKHEFISKNEIKYYWLTSLGLILSFTFFINSLIIKEHTTDTQFILGMKIFVTVGIGFSLGYFVNTYLNVYYPFWVERKLHKLRFKDRISPVTGKSMRLLTENEEDLHLTKDMIEHEKIRAFEYDVWIDDESGYKLIETYRGNLQLVICEKCNYRTAHEIKEKLVKEPSTDEEGLLTKHYKCSYCDHEQSSESKIATLSSV